MSRVAAEVRAAKEKHPEHYCPVPSCLWRIKTSRGDSPCQKHPVPKDTEASVSSETISADDLRCGDTVIINEQPERVIAIMDGYVAFASGRVVPCSGSFTLADRLPHADDTTWHVSGRYYANAMDAATWRTIEREKAIRRGVRFARVIARMAGEQAAD